MTTILFVHLGHRIPHYLVCNIQRTSELFPSLNLVLVTSSPNLPKSLPPGLVVLHPDNLSWKRERQKINRDQRFWGGWWQKTFDRLLMIQPVHQLFPSGGILHIESDTIIFPSFPFDTLQQQAKIAYPMYSNSMGVASVVYSPSLEKSKKLEEEILQELTVHTETSDMDALGAIVPRLGQDFSQLQEFPIEKTSIDGVPLNLGLFDGLSHGEWLCGRDPKAHWGFGMRRVRTPNSKEQVFPLYDYSDQQMFLYFIDSGLKVPLNNLHVHSKELYFFQLDQGSRLKSTIVKVNQSPDRFIYFFKFGGFVYCLISNLKIWSSSMFSTEAWIRLGGRWLRRFRKSNRRLKTKNPLK